MQHVQQKIRSLSFSVDHESLSFNKFIRDIFQNSKTVDHVSLTCTASEDDAIDEIKPALYSTLFGVKFVLLMRLAMFTAATCIMISENDKVTTC